MEKKLFRSSLFALGFLALVSLSSSMLFAQATASSALVGTVSDKTGAVVVGATITATDTATGTSRTATTNSLGAYRFDVLPPGIYTVKVALQGFSSPTASNVELFVGRATTQDFSLNPGATSTTVEVTAEAPILDQQKTSVGMEITPQDVEN